MQGTTQVMYCAGSSGGVGACGNVTGMIGSP